MRLESPETLPPSTSYADTGEGYPSRFHEAKELVDAISSGSKMDVNGAT